MDEDRVVDEFIVALKHANQNGLLDEFVSAFLQDLNTEDLVIREAIRHALYEWDL